MAKNNSTGSPVKTVLDFIKSNKIKFIDFKFMDIPGQWQHFTVPSSQLDSKSSMMDLDLMDLR